MAYTTRRSLLVRIKDRNDLEAWNQFVDVYGPLIFRFGRRKGLQEADAADMMQDALQRVLQNINSFDYNPKLGRFRSWLLLISSQCLAGQLGTRQPVATGTSGSKISDLVDQTAWIDDENYWESEYRHNILKWAMEQVRPGVSELTWNAFWETAILGKRAEEVAERFNLSVGAVYLAKSRIIKKLKRKVATVDDSLE